MAVYNSRNVFAGALFVSEEPRSKSGNATAVEIPRDIFHPASFIVRFRTSPRPAVVRALRHAALLGLGSRQPAAEEPSQLDTYRFAPTSL